MAKQDFIAKATATIDAPVSTVWDSLMDPAQIKQFMFGTEAVSDWKVGSPIVWKGEWQGKPYEDKGVILKIDPQHILQYSHFSPLSGDEDVPENYHTLTFELSGEGDKTHIDLSQDNNASKEDRDHSKDMWQELLVSLKKVVEAQTS